MHRFVSFNQIHWELLTLQEMHRSGECIMVWVGKKTEIKYPNKLFSDVDPMGLFLSLEPTQSVRPGHFFKTYDPNTFYYTLQ